jgi:DNA ligase-1
MRLAELVAASNAVAANPARLEKTRILAELLQALTPEEVPIAVAFLAGRLRQGRLGLGHATLWEARNDPPAPREPSLFDAPGTDAPLTLLDVDAAFGRLALARGKGVASQRAAILAELYGRASAEERDFLERLLLAELRQGALLGVMVDAVARASGLPLADIRRAAMLAGDLEPVAVAALTGAPLDQFKLEVFKPVLPMLAQPALDIGDAMTRLGEAALEWKLDGARIQVHRRGTEVRVYTRALREVTHAVPEVVETVGALPLTDAILDGEVIALRPDGRPHAFQDTMRRFGRQLEIESMRATLPLTTFLFDVLHLDGRDTLDLPQRERFSLLEERAPELVVPHLLTSDSVAAAAFLDEAFARGHEGVMAKAPGAPYEAGGRGASWLKVKSAHTLDLVVLAAEWGNGRRQGWLSNLHLGARDPATGEFVMLGKTFKGMTDELLEWQTHAFEDRAVRREGNTVFLPPEFVVEIAFDDIQASPRYPGGMALRLARVKRYRPDKTAAEADTVDTVRAILEGQTAKKRR